MAKKIKKQVRKYYKKAIAFGLILAMASTYVTTEPAKAAAALASAKDVISSSAPSIAIQHQFVFTTTTLLTTDATAAADANFFFQFPMTNPDPFTIGALAAGDVTVTCTACDTSVFAVTAVTVADGGGEAKNDNVKVAVNETGQDSANIPAGSVITLTIDSSPGITNPAEVTADDGIADVYSIDIATREDSGDVAVDTGTSMVAIIEGITVSVTVDESLSFSIALVTSGNCTQGGGGTAVTTTVTTVPFGTSGLSADTFYRGCHDLIVATNAQGGYSITAEENTSLLRTGSGDRTINDAICDASDCTSVIGASTTTAWATASANHGFGYTCSGGGCNAEFNSATEFNAFSCRSSTAAECDPVDGPLALATPISGSATAGQTSRIVYKLSFNDDQPAGTYSNTITYITTPTF